MTCADAEATGNPPVQHAIGRNPPGHFARLRLRAAGCCPMFRHGTVFTGAAGNPGCRGRRYALASPTKLRLDDVSMAFATPAGAFQALADVSLVVPSGRFVSLIGP